MGCVSRAVARGGKGEAPLASNRNPASFPLLAPKGGMMDKRPLSLTIIGWFLIVTGLFGAYASLTMGSNEMARQIIADSGMSLRLQQGLAVVGAIVVVASAYGIFKGLPWSRVLYVGWMILSLAIGLLTSPFKGMLMLSVLFVVVIAYFLFRPEANAWFAAKGLQLHRGK